MNRFVLAAAVGTFGCAHGITVFAPASDVPEDGQVVAAIRPGVVQTFAEGASLRRDGDVVADGKVLGHMAPSDTLVVRVGAGDDVGRLHVQRTVVATGVMVTGAIVVAVGATASLLAAGTCAGSNSSEGGGGLVDFSGLADLACFGLGFIGVVASFGIGLAMLVAGSNGALTMRKNVRLDAGGIRVSF